MKFHGNVGFFVSVDIGHHVYKQQFVEKPYYGDVLRDTKRYEPGQKINDDLTINNQISIVADQFAYDNFGCMRYVIWRGQKWKITEAGIDYPRIILSIGGLYNVSGNTEEP